MSAPTHTPTRSPTQVMRGRPVLSQAEAEELAGDLFGFDAAASPLVSERDQNFKLRKESGEKAVLKIFNSLEPVSLIADRVQALAMLAQSELPVPRILNQSTVEHAGESHHVWLVSWLDGTPLALARPITSDLEHQVGSVLGKMDAVLKGIDQQRDSSTFAWDLANASKTLREHIQYVSPVDTHLVQHFLDLFDLGVKPRWASLPKQTIHNDGNDYNLLVGSATESPRQLKGILDFGDMVHSARIGNAAIAAAYLAMHQEDPIDTMCAVLAGYHSVNEVSDEEVDVFFALAGVRLATTLSVSAKQRSQEPDNEYLSVSKEGALNCLRKLVTIHPRQATYRLRAALGWEPVPGSEDVKRWIANRDEQFAPVVRGEDPTATPVIFDFSVGSLEFGPSALTVPGVVEAEIWSRTGSGVGVGRWDEVRLAYTGDQYLSMSGERRTVHMGVDLFRPDGTPVHAPLDGIVHSFCAHHERFDYGGCIVLEHRPEDSPVFWTLYGHLSHASISEMVEGRLVEQGEVFAHLGRFEENGGWVAHLHFQIITDMLDMEGTFPGVAAPGQRETWRSLSPSPMHLLGLSDEVNAPQDSSTGELLDKRSNHMGSALSIAYKDKLHIVRGYMQTLYDTEGRAFLDAVNNVPHVGHSNPRVVDALHRQMRTLTTNTRYLHSLRLEYAERLTATMPAPLEVCFFLNSGSEATDLALRLARTYTGNSDTVVLDGAYHGNLTTLIDISPYKFDGAGGGGKPSQTHISLMPDTYRGPYKGMTARSGLSYAKSVSKAAEGGNVAAFIAESVPGCGGQIVPPPGYLRAAAAHIREAGGVFIADEVQVGLGRVGTHFWGFQLDDDASGSIESDIVPDIVVLGKPLGNGHPLAAVVTTRAIADAFDNGMEYFNTFGGNPASCAVGLAVLDEIEDCGLQENARVVGNHLLEGLEQLKARHPIVGDVRGAGLFIGIELVRDQDTLEPADTEATYVTDRMRDNGILISTDGPLHNVLKIKPPLVFTEDNADHLAQSLDLILAEDAVTTRVKS